MPERSQFTSPEGRSPTPGPLAGLLVADLSRVLAGPYATQILGDLGATVIKVESRDGDETRGWKPPHLEGVSAYYLGVNRNKRDVVFDFRSSEDRALAQELTTRADIVIENFKPGTLAKYGLDYAAVSRRNPRVIYASISGFGSVGGAHLPGYDLVVQAASGLMSLTGAPDGPAYCSGVSVFDIMTGMHAVIGVLAALNDRNYSGVGQHMEANLLSFRNGKPQFHLCDDRHDPVSINTVVFLNKLRETMRQTQHRYVHASDTPQLFYFSAGTCQKIHAQIAFAFVALAFLNHY